MDRRIPGRLMVAIPLGILDLTVMKSVFQALAGILLVTTALGGPPDDNGRFDPQARPRVVILTDISNEPDDQMSLVRFLTYANEFEVEGLIATTSCWRQRDPDLPAILRVLDAYESAWANLRIHAPGYPTADELRRVAFRGIDGYGMEAADREPANPAVAHIRSVLEREDPRPVWFCAWGGGNTLGAAMQQLLRERPADAARLAARIRGYEIALQDDGWAYVAHQFPESLLISARLLWKGISRTTIGFNAWSESWGGDNDLFSRDWVERHVRTGHGPLGEQYPEAVYLWEGDTPSFLHLIPNGLSNPEQPHFGGWGGRFHPERIRNVRSGSGNETVDPLLDRHRDYHLFSDAQDAWSFRGTGYRSAYATVFRWRRHFQNDFAARMDWCVSDRFESANHNPIPILNGDPSRRVVPIDVRAGDTVTLSAEGTSDPDGDAFTLRWWIYPEAGSLRTPDGHGLPAGVELTSESGSVTRLVAPSVDQPETLHVILEVEDGGTPNLVAYRRAILRILPAP